MLHFHIFEEEKISKKQLKQRTRTLDFIKACINKLGLYTTYLSKDFDYSFMKLYIF